MALGQSGGFNWIIGGLAAAILLPTLAVGVGLPFWLAGGAAILAGGGAVLLLAPRRPFEGLDAGRIGRGRIELARELLAEAMPLAARLDVAARAIRSSSARLRVHRLAQAARGILGAIEKDPLKLDRAQRFLVYYLPRSVEMAEGYQLLEQKQMPDPARLMATSDLLDRLDGAFAKFADGLLDADVDRLDIELKLLKSSLDEDLGPVAGKPTAAPVSVPRTGA
ncbi:MAG TPA: 5-bromo-4-chloroindolyl phosphate hydrolysis family protein [Stellaceae bacterium]|nr:5-bromo-4-chloroindolyl phosphate hydrolysis family protein [Stellaceae bacterium]